MELFGLCCNLAVSHKLLLLRGEVFHPTTCKLVRLLGPCFKTGGSNTLTKPEIPAKTKPFTPPIVQKHKNLYS